MGDQADEVAGVLGIGADVVAADAHLAGGGGDQAGGDAEQGAFAGAVGTADA